MRILNVNNQEILNPDYSLGYTKPCKIFIKHHEAVKEVKEEFHYNVIAEYPNGGRDLQKVVDTPAQEAKEAWDEYEDIQRYIEYTPEELAQMHKPSRLDRLESIIFYIAMKTGNSEVFGNV